MKLYETINAENWAKGIMRSRDGSRACIVGHAIALYPIGDRESVYRDIEDAIRVVFPGRTRGIIGDFNDHPDTTVDDVIRVCKVADV